jgi:general secretion pathway protein G
MRLPARPGREARAEPTVYPPEFLDAALHPLPTRPTEAMKTLHLPRRPDRSRQAFTLAEMMVVIVILGLLAALVVPNVMQRLATAQRGTIKSDIVAIESALEQYALNNSGRYPDSLEVLVTPDVNGYTILKGKVVPKDPWKNEYLYEAPGPGQKEPIIKTLGKDMQPGGEGEDLDIDNQMIRNGELEG